MKLTMNDIKEVTVDISEIYHILNSKDVPRSVEDYLKDLGIKALEKSEFTTICKFLALEEGVITPSDKDIEKHYEFYREAA